MGTRHAINECPDSSPSPCHRGQPACRQAQRLHLYTTPRPMSRRILHAHFTLDPRPISNIALCSRFSSQTPRSCLEIIRQCVPSTLCRVQPTLRMFVGNPSWRKDIEGAVNCLSMVQKGEGVRAERGGWRVSSGASHPMACTCYIAGSNSLLWLQINCLM